MQETIIEAGRSERYYWRDLWKFKELLYILAKRDVTVRYKQTFVGVAWAVVRPVMTVLAFVFAFHKVAKIEDKSGIDFGLIVFSGVIFWNFFASSFQQVSNSITGNANLVSKVYFPRLLMPLSAAAVPLLDFFVGFAILFPFLLFKGVIPNWHLFFVPLFLLLGYLSALSLGVIFAALNVQFRDFQQLVPLIVQYGFFVCPVAYSVATIQGLSWFKYYYWVNPLAGIIEGFRWSILPNYPYFDWSSFIPSLIFIVITTIIAVYFFRKKENSFVDYI
ncbi:MAG: ABC transporter permease [Spirosomataceae bacterium]|jgi:lipopolysaccharide transport system permease protein|nr:ABC transporter permease [Flectobacillus sp.]